MTRSARIAFLLLAVATFGALYVAQRLRHSDPVVLGVRVTRTFSPVGSGPRTAALSFWLKRDDIAAVTVVDDRGDEVRSLADGRAINKRTRTAFVWDGNKENGNPAPDGWYRFRIGLARQGRSLTIPNGTRLDTKPAMPVVKQVEPTHPAGPLILPGAKLVVGRIGGTKGRNVEGFVLRTDTVPSKVVRRFPLPDNPTSIRWDGKIYGHAAPDGVYLLGLTETDGAGNRGSAPAKLTPVAGPPRGKPGVTVRHLGVQAPSQSATPGQIIELGVDARGQSFEWSLRPATGGPLLSHGKAKGAKLRIRIPSKARGVLQVTVAGNKSRVNVPLAINTGKAPLLVVLPAIRWQGLAPVDGDGDGLPDLLPLGRSASVDRLMPPIKGGLDGWNAKVLPLLRVMAQNRITADATTDIALAKGQGPKIAGYKGVVLAGEETWLPSSVLKGLRSRVNGGKRVLDLGLDSLRRTVDINGAVISNPSKPTEADALGGVRSPSQADASYQLQWKDSIGLFSTTGGRIYAPPGWSGTAKVESPGAFVAAAGPEAGIAGIAAWKLGKGLYIRPGIPNLAANALAGPTLESLLTRALAITAGQ